MTRRTRKVRAEARPARGRLERRSVLVGAAWGAVAMYYMDPSRGRVRRHVAVDRACATARHARRRLARELRVRAAFARGRAHGVAHRMRPGPAPELDDATLAHKVESIVFRDPRVPKGRISVNAEHGVVFLRGELDTDDLIAQLERSVRAVSGVKSVENLLHVPGTPAPHAPGGALLHD
jgi:hypothetical protein